MPEVFQRTANPAPLISSTEIHIPDDADLGTGTFTVVVAPNSFDTEHGIAASKVNNPVFQITATMNGMVALVVTLGRADEPNPRSIVPFHLPKNIRRNVEHTVKIEFAAWNVFSATFDDEQLQQAFQPDEH